MESTDYTDYPECMLVIATINLSVAYGIRFRDALESDSTCLPADTRKRMD
jgi:hypothetical protein